MKKGSLRGCARRRLLIIKLELCFMWTTWCTGITGRRGIDFPCRHVYWNMDFWAERAEQAESIECNLRNLDSDKIQPQASSELIPFDVECQASMPSTEKPTRKKYLSSHITRIEHQIKHP